MDTRKKMTRKDFLLEVLAATIGVALGTVIGTRVHEWLKRKFSSKPIPKGIGIYQQLQQNHKYTYSNEHKAITLEELKKTVEEMMWKKPPTNTWVIHRRAGKVIITELN